MKKLLLIAILCFSQLAMAGVVFNQGASGSGITDNTGGQNFGVDASTEAQKRDPVSSATAPSSMSVAPCQGWTSTGGQLIFAGVSHGHSFTITWCVAEMMGDHELAKQILCNTDGEYKKARAQQGDACLE